MGKIGKKDKSEIKTLPLKFTLQQIFTLNEHDLAQVCYLLPLKKSTNLPKLCIIIDRKHYGHVYNLHRLIWYLYRKQRENVLQLLDKTDFDHITYAIDPNRTMEELFKMHGCVLMLRYADNVRYQGAFLIHKEAILVRIMQLRKTTDPKVQRWYEMFTETISDFILCEKTDRLKEQGQKLGIPEFQIASTVNDSNNGSVVTPSPEGSLVYRIWLLWLKKKYPFLFDSAVNEVIKIRFLDYLLQFNERRAKKVIAKLTPQVWEELPAPNYNKLVNLDFLWMILENNNSISSTEISTWWYNNPNLPVL